jgi:TPP-dependent pyruvate/acetoin dehydrogenase alpha subunit
MDVSPIETAPVSEPLSVIRDDGSADPKVDPRIDGEEARALYASMLVTRVVDERIAALGEAGVVGFLPRATGREAALVGTLAGLEGGDWLFPTHADWAAALQRGMSLASFVHRVFGDAEDALKGRDMPGGLSARALRIASVSAPAGTHLPHAVGLAWAARQRGDDLVSAALFDAPEVDAADFHTGLNFAGVMKTPTLFVCRVREGEAGAAEHAIAYGLAQARCDGSDLLAVVRTLRGARARAASGEGATVIDLVLGGDDDAMRRTRAYLDTLGGFTDEDERALRARTEEQLAAAIESASRTSPPSLETLFDDVYAALPPHLEAERQALLRGPRAR